jgi:hypothetical protein
MGILKGKKKKMPFFHVDPKDILKSERSPSNPISWGAKLTERTSITYLIAKLILFDK